MRLSRTLLLASLASTGAALAPAPAAACVLLPDSCIGSRSFCKPSAAERRRQERRASAEETRRRLTEARKRLAAGGVDMAAELSELLVPNVRPVEIQQTSCGPMGEIDYAEGHETIEARFEALVAGTPLAGEPMDGFGRVLREEEDLRIGEPCNAEFRRGFAAWLRQALRPEDLRDAWLFLAARQRTQGHYGPVYHRLTRFGGKTRNPPVVWIARNEWLQGEIAKALGLTPWGRSLGPALDSFWGLRSAELGDESRLCPEASERWAKIRERVVPKLIAIGQARRPR
jgi:hypothetical protein